MWHDTRKQARANVKFLYGPDVEVITLRVDSPRPGLCQAVAVNLHPSNNTWTKHLHGEPADEFNYATLNLLRESEEELAKLFSANGNTIPFEGDTAQVLHLGRGHRRDSSAGNSLQSDFVFIATPGSSLSDGIATRELVEEGSPEYPASEIHAQEAVLEPADELPGDAIPEPPEPLEPSEPTPEDSEPSGSVWGSSWVSSWGTFKTDKKKHKSAFALFDPLVRVEETQLEESPIQEPVEVEVEEPTAEAFIPAEACPSVNISEDPIPVEDEEPTVVEACSFKYTSEDPMPVEDEEPTVVEACSFEYAAEEPMPAEAEELTPVEACSFEYAAEEPMLAEAGELTPVEACPFGCAIKEPESTEASLVESIVKETPAPEFDPAAKEDLGWGSFFRTKNEKEKKSSEVVMELIGETIREPKLDVEDPIEEWEPTMKRKKEKEGKKIRKEVVERIGEDIIEPIEPEPAPKLAVEDTQGPEIKSKKADGLFSFSVAPWSAPDLLCELEPVFEDALETSGAKAKKSRKKKCKDLKVHIELAPEPKPVVEKSEYKIKKKSKKEKRVSSFGIVSPGLEPLALPLEPELVVEDTEGFKIKGEKKGKAVEPTSELTPPGPELEPEPAPEFNVNISISPPEKEKIINLDPEPNAQFSMPYESKEKLPNQWAQFSVSKENKKGHEEMPEMPLGDESPIAKDPGAEVLEVPPTPEPVMHSVATTSPAQTAFTEATPNTFPPPAPPSGQTVIFTVQFPDEIDKKPVQAMITLADNTRAAIFEAVHLYLDLKGSFIGRPGPRVLKIKSGVGRNGEVDLSMLGEIMWPEYLEYFRQYTKLPELTVDCSYL